MGRQRSGVSGGMRFGGRLVWIGAVAALAGLTSSAQAALLPVFACSFGTKQVAVTAEAGAWHYVFGPSGKAELELLDTLPDDGEDQVPE